MGYVSNFAAWGVGAMRAETGSISDRLNFLKLDEEALVALRTLKPLVEKHLPHALDAFYQHMAGFPEVSRFFADGSQLQRARQAQITHWINISSGRFGDDYLKSAHQIGRTHAHLGIKPSYYIGGYALVVDHLIGAILAETRPSRFLATRKKAEGTATALGVLMKAVMLDMDLAISAYIDNVEQLRLESEARSAAALKNHAAEVDRLLGDISGAVKETAGNAQQANELARGTREAADRGGKVVGKAVEAMSLIEGSSRRISDIIGVIDEIARQTNLLALNAAVEAARAGEAGQGFAVVASEVRSLAQRSSDAAKDIKDLISKSNSQVKDGVSLVNGAGAALNEIVESIKEVATVISAIATAGTEQAASLEEVASTLSQMDEVSHNQANERMPKRRREPCVVERPLRRVARG